MSSNVLPLSDDRDSRRFDPLGAVLSSMFTSWESDRRERENEWFRCMCDFEQIKNPDDPGGSVLHNHIMSGISRTKALTAYARITDIFFHPSDKHWGVKPTPKPNLPYELMEEIKRSVLSDAVLKGVFDPMEIANAIKQEVMRVAEQRAEAAERDMEDKLVDMNYDTELASALLDCCIYGTGILYGVTPGVRRQESWRWMGDGWELTIGDVKFPDAGYRSLFDIFPDPLATSEEDATGVFERSVLTVSAFKSLKSDPRFNAEAIDDVLRSNPRGNHSPIQNETDRRDTARVGRTTTGADNRFDVLKYWGVCDGRDLRTTGMEVEPDEKYWCNVWVCGNRTLFAQLSPLKRQRIPYHFLRYTRSKESIWGTGLVWMMRHSKAAVQTIRRSMLDNAAFASGPQVEYMAHLIRGGNDGVTLQPWGKWIRDDGDPAFKAVNFWQPELIVQPLERMMDIFRRDIDEETSMPSYTHGQQVPGLNKTATGTELLMNAADITTKNIVRNIEKGIVSFLQSLFDWEMEWNDDESIKGDSKIVVQASAVLMSKAMHSQRLMQLATTFASIQPIAQSLNWIALARDIAGALDVNPDNYLPDEQAASEISRGLNLAPGMGGISGVLDQPVGAVSQGFGAGVAGPAGAPIAGQGPTIA